MKISLDDYVPILLDPICSDYEKLPKSPFLWGDVCLQRQWNFYVHPTEQQAVNAMLIAGVMSQVTNFLSPMKVKYNVHSWLRCRQYNTFIGGARESAHLDAAAIDFDIEGANCNVIFQRLKSEVTRLDIRMEDLGENALWVHLDLKPAINGVRIFRP